MDAGADYVGTVRIRRHDVLWRKAASRLMNRVRERTTSIRITDQGCMLRGYHRSVIDALNRCREVSTYVPALAYTFARHPVEIEVAHAERTVGQVEVLAVPPHPAELRPDDRLSRWCRCSSSPCPASSSHCCRSSFVVFLAIRRLVVGPEAEGVFTLFAHRVLPDRRGADRPWRGRASTSGASTSRCASARATRSPRCSAQTRTAERSGAAALPRSPGSSPQRAAAAATGARSGGVSPGRAVVFAYHDVGVRCLKALLSAGLEIPLVVTVPDDPHETPLVASVAATAADYGLRLTAPATRTARELHARCWRSCSPDFMFSFYYRALLGAPLLQCARRGALNMHGSLLPKYRGRAAGQLGDPARRARDRRDAALHGGARRCRRHRRSRRPCRS